MLAVWPRTFELVATVNPAEIHDAAGQMLGLLDQPIGILGFRSETFDPVEIVEPPACDGPYLLVSQLGTDDALVQDAAWYAADFGIH